MDIVTRAGIVVAGALAAVLIAPAGEAQATTTTASKALSVAAAQRNDPYVWGATGPDRFDCSGLVHYAYKKAGYDWPRRLTAQGQYNRSHKISRSSLKPGDLVAIGRSSGSIYHIGIYAGRWSGMDWMWNANTGKYRGRKVVLAPVYEYTAGTPRAYYGRL